MTSRTAPVPGRPLRDVVRDPAALLVRGRDGGREAGALEQREIHQVVAHRRRPRRGWSPWRLSTSRNVASLSLTPTWISSMPSARKRCDDAFERVPRDERDLEPGALPVDEAGAVDDREALHRGSVVAEVQRAVGEDAVDVEDEEPDRGEVERARCHRGLR